MFVLELIKRKSEINVIDTVFSCTLINT